jgi:hypothetical protein
MTVECPYCEYEGRVSSVEAHISGSRDEAHQGRVGQSFREELPQLESGGSPGTMLVIASLLLVVTVAARSSSSREDRR